MIMTQMSKLEYIFLGGAQGPYTSLRFRFDFVTTYQLTNRPFYFFLPGFVIAFSLCLIILGILVTFGFSAIVNLIIDSQVVLRKGGQSYGWWSKPPVEPKIKVYVYNVTNADEFLNNGSKPILEELGPYVYK